MAVPASMTTADLSGRYVLNSTLSDSTDGILTLQGVPWYTRKIIRYATITLDVKQYTGKPADPTNPKESERQGDDFEHIDTDQTLTGGIKGTSENRTFSGLPRDHEDHLFGAVVGLSKRITGPLSDSNSPVAKYEFLQKGWTKDTLENPKGVIYTQAVSNTEISGKVWTAEQVWGLEEFNGEKRFTKHVYFFTPEETVTAKMVYDYQGPTPV
ncbi:hypothetical protein FRC19_004174 [Serendipita sp. 401]|nr:hypothetical protein FRC19_004174 [Serendipita sp. 401]